jgi:hypothetical protein
MEVTQEMTAACRKTGWNLNTKFAQEVIGWGGDDAIKAHNIKRSKKVSKSFRRWKNRAAKGETPTKKTTGKK